MPAYLRVLVYVLLGSSGFLSAADKPNEQRMVQLSYDEAMNLPVFQALAQLLNCDLALDQAVTQPVSMLAYRVSPQSALDGICEDIGCRWRSTDGHLVVEPRPAGIPSSLLSHSAPLSAGLDGRLNSGMRFEAVPLKLALLDVFRSAGVSYMLFGQSLSETALVTLDVSGNRIADAIPKILRNAGIKDFTVRQTLENPPSYFVIVQSSNRSR